MAEESPKEPWKIEVNDRYQKVVGTIISLATAALVLPVLFLRQILGIAEKKPLIDHLNCSVYLSWGFLGAAILFGLCFYYGSAKWVKSAWGQRVAISPSKFERALDFMFWAMAIAFLIGISFLVLFVVTVKVTN
jgi:hypothetical protein